MKVKSVYRADIRMEDLDTGLINDSLFSNFFQWDHTRKSEWLVYSQSESQGKAVHRACISLEVPEH